MQPFKIDLDQLEWQSPLPGARFKLHREGGKQLRVLELTREFVEADWCERGHIGYVLEGDLEIDFRGRVVTYRKGDGVFIPPGPESGHKARALAPIARLVLVEDD